MIERLARFGLRFTVSAFQATRRSVWFFSRPLTLGVHAVALTPEGRVVLVRLTYASGWRLPGGGRKKDEPPREALLRELREEIGLIAHGAVEHAFEFLHEPDFRRGEASMFIVRDVQYRARRWSLEIGAVQDFDPRSLPVDTSPLAREQIGRALAPG